MKCNGCELGRTAYTQVPGNGFPKPELFIIGEGPGKAEEVIGRPFVGPAGRLLRKALAEAGMSHTKYYFSNIVQCRATDSASGPNRAPTQKEQLACFCNVGAELIKTQPQVVLLVGRIASTWKAAVLRRVPHAMVHCESHPSYVLRQGEQAFEAYVNRLRKVVQDVELVRARSHSGSTSDLDAVPRKSTTGIV